MCYRAVTEITRTAKSFVRAPSWVAIFLCLTATVNAQRMTTPKASVQFVRNDFAVGELDNPSWKKADKVAISQYWQGATAPTGRRSTARMLWSDTALYVRFEAEQTEPLVVSQNPDVSKKTMQLWDRDVCELFLASDPKKAREYFEFEVAPTGEWIDLKIDFTGAERKTDWDYKSGMTSAARIAKGKIIVAMRIPWSALGAKPKTGDVWLGNLFRCVGKDPNRGYLAWSPTMSEKPNFHVPEKFGEFEFVAR
jgi:alpha-galactosidase